MFTFSLKDEDITKIRHLYKAALAYYEWNESEYHGLKHLSEDLKYALKEMETVWIVENEK